jgi:hypothetical protein
MSGWLARATSAIADTPTVRGAVGISTPCAVSVFSVDRSKERPLAQAIGAKDTKDTAPPIVGETASMVGYRGPFSSELSALQAANPTTDDQRWREACFDARRFLSQWGVNAADLDWTAAHLFGIHPIAPFSRYDVMGLVWLLRGRSVVDLDRNGARLSSGNRITKPTSGPGIVQ